MCRWAPAFSRGRGSTSGPCSAFRIVREGQPKRAAVNALVSLLGSASAEKAEPAPVFWRAIGNPLVDVESVSIKAKV
jgi:hypothetical protein